MRRWHLEKKRKRGQGCGDPQSPSPVSPVTGDQEAGGRRGSAFPGRKQCSEFPAGLNPDLRDCSPHSYGQLGCKCPQERRGHRTVASEGQISAPVQLRPCGGLSVVSAPLTALRRASLAEGSLHFQQILKPPLCGPFPSSGVLVEPLNLAGSLAGPAQCHLPRQPWGLRAAFKHPSVAAPTGPHLGQADSAASGMAFLALNWQGCC